MYWSRFRGKGPINFSEDPGPSAARMNFSEDPPESLTKEAKIVRNISHWSPECSCHLRLEDEKIVRDKDCSWIGNPDLEQYYCAT